MLSWLRRLFARRPEPARPTRPPTVGATRAVVVPIQAAAPPAPPPPAPFAKPPACSDELVDGAVQAVMAHFRENQPGPGSFPGIATRIVSVIQERDADFNKLVQTVGQDAAIAARLLQVANSALFIRGEEVASVRAAALKLGLRDVGEIALGLAGRSLFESKARSEYALFPDRWDALFHQSMTAAFACASLSLSARVGQSDRAFLAGMLHDVGKPIALRALAAIHYELEPQVISDGVDAVVEKTHVRIGASMTITWSLPEYLRAVTSQHHDDEVPADPALAELHIVRVVDGLMASRAGTLDEATQARMKQSAAVLRLDDNRLRVAATDVEDHARRVTQIFKVADPVAPVTRRAAQ